MADICRSCALRAQRSATSAVKQQISRRTFTVSSSQQKRVGPPVFSDTTKPELDDVLLTLRNNHFIPAYLNKRQRHLIFGDKFKTELDNNPAYATLGDEEVQLKHVDRRKDVPARRPLMRQALALMQEHEDWRQLPGMLEGVHKGDPKPDAKFEEKIIRKALQADQLSVVIRILNRSVLTGITLRNDNILNLLLWGLHEHAQAGQWDEERVKKTLRYANEVAQLLESEEHGTGRKIAANDPRTRPTTIATYLELYAVYAHKFNAGKDYNDNARKYAERLLACINETNQPTEQDLPKHGPQTEFLSRFPIWHGLSLAKSVLGSDLPQASKAQQIIQTYEARLSELAKQIETQNNGKTNGYGAQALDAWKAAIRV